MDDKKQRRARFEQLHAKKYFGIWLDCGHRPTDPGDSLDETGSPHVTGYATWDNKRLCFSCSAEKIKENMIQTGMEMLYLSEDGQRVTTWDGHGIAPVHITRKTRGNFGDARWYFRFRFNGEVWSGMGQGPSMYCRVKRTKYKDLLA